MRVRRIYADGKIDSLLVLTAEHNPKNFDGPLEVLQAWVDESHRHSNRRVVKDLRDGHKIDAFPNHLRCRRMPGSFEKADIQPYRFPSNPIFSSTWNRTSDRLEGIRSVVGKGKGSAGGSKNGVWSLRRIKKWRDSCQKLREIRVKARKSREARLMPIPASLLNSKDYRGKNDGVG